MLRVWQVWAGLFLGSRQAWQGCACALLGVLLGQAGVHPEQPGRSVQREEFEALWKHSVLLLQRGFKTGSILTVDEEEAKKLGKPWTRRWALVAAELLAPGAQPSSSAASACHRLPLHGLCTSRCKHPH